MPQKGVSGVNSLHLKGFEDPREDRIVPRRPLFKLADGGLGDVVDARLVDGLLGGGAVDGAVIRH